MKIVKLYIHVHLTYKEDVNFGIQERERGVPS